MNAAPTESARRGFAPLRCSAEYGFTLVEVVVALFIFAMLATAGVAMLSFAVRAQASSARALADVSDARRMSAILISDLAQAVPRVTRDAAGQGRPAFRAEEGGLILAYVRGGSRPQYVELKLQSGQIVRVVAWHADGAGEGTPMLLAENVSAATLRFRTKNEWEDRWTPTRTDALPRAIELTITENGEARVRKRARRRVADRPFTGRGDRSHCRGIARTAEASDPAIWQHGSH
jgi:general secretion pathway protein J